MLGDIPPRRARWYVNGMVAGTLVLVACGGFGGATGPTATLPPVPTPVPSPSPPPNAILIGPAASPFASPSPSPSPGAGQNYTVAAGDTLATIAARVYGDEGLWRRIYDANRNVIGDNPDNLKVGTTLRIPPR